MISETVGRFYSVVLSSDRGSSFFDIDTTEEPIQWSEYGVNRFLFWNLLVYFALFFAAISAISQSFSYRMVLSAIVISLYMKEKSSPIIVQLMDDLDKVEIEREPPIEEQRKYKILRDIVNGDDVFESIERYD